MEVHRTARLRLDATRLLSTQTCLPRPGIKAGPQRKCLDCARLRRSILLLLFSGMAAASLLVGCGDAPASIPISGPPPAPPVSPPATTINSAVTATNLYSVNTAGPSIDVYAANLNGTASPTSSYPGAALSVTGDAAGNLYVATYSATQAAVQVYAAGSTGASRSITVANAATNPPQISTIAVDSAGYLYVAISNSILVYSPTASGSPAPVRMLAGAHTTLSPGAT